jgi:hypothetical protein
MMMMMMMIDQRVEGMQQSGTRRKLASVTPQFATCRHQTSGARHKRVMMMLMILKSQG